MPFRMLALSLLLGSACAKPPPSGPVGTGMLVTVEGSGPVWPPVGEGCDALVRCCDAMAAVERAMNLGCQLGAATGGTCPELQAKMTSMFAEMQPKAPLPAECAP